MKRSATLLVVLLSACTEPPPPVVTGLVDATEVDVASKIPGRVKALAVREGDTVQEGQELVTIESQEVLAKIDQVSAGLDAAQAKLALARKGARREERDAAQRQLDAARHQAELARKNFDRVSALFSSGAVPQAQMDDAQSKNDLAKDQLAVAEAHAAIVAEGARPEELEALAALVRQGQGTLAEVRSYGSETVQRAPIAGEVSKIVVHKGELAATGYPIITLVDRSDMWVSFPVREDLLRNLKQGDTLQVEVPALGRTLPVQVTSIAALGDFATWKATSEKARFDLKSFEVKARPTVTVAELRPGMTARWTPGR